MAIAKIKLFKELDYDDFIYYINPFIAVRNYNIPLELLVQPTIGGQDLFIQPVKIKNVRGIPDDIRYKDWVEIEYFRPEPILHSPDIEMIPTVKLLFNGLRNFALTIVKLEDQKHSFPVPYCTDLEFLKNYIKSSR